MHFFPYVGKDMDIFSILTDGSIERRKKFDQILEKIEKPWIACEMKREYAALLVEKPNIKLVELDNPHIFASSNMNAAIRTETCANDDAILDMMFNAPKITEDEFLYEELNLIRLENRALSVKTISMLVRMRATIYISNPKDCVEIVEAINGYMQAIKDYQYYDLHYTPPPKEELDPINIFRNIILPIANAFEDKGQGNFALAQLLGISAPSATGMAAAQRKIELNGAKENFTVVNNFGHDLKDPYKFSNFGRF